MNKLINIIQFLGLTCLLAREVTATNLPTNYNPWFIGASIGMGGYLAMPRDGNTAFGRLHFGRDLITTEQLLISTELGLQNGIRVILDVPKDDLDALGGVPITGTIKPVIDLLLSAKVPFGEKPFFGLVKGGVAFRQLQMDRLSVNNLSKASAEIQLGAGYIINEHTNLTLSWQYISGGNPHFKSNLVDATGKVSNIPTQMAALLGITIFV